jgi:hypothetical protein
MGFSIYIYCQLDICKDTGRHFYYKGFEKIYDMPKAVPEEYREYVNMKGRVFRIYTELITDETSTTVVNFLDKYPDFSDVLDNSDFDPNSWNAYEHCRFYDALKWFSEQDICYIISWS